jgi:hypothetical protein
MAIGGAGQGVTKNSLVVGSNMFLNNTVRCWGSGTSGPSGPSASQAALCADVMACCLVLRQVTGAVGGGGGFSLNLMPSMLMSDCIFDGNTASQTGAGMAVVGSTTSTFSATNLTCVLIYCCILMLCTAGLICYLSCCALTCLTACGHVSTGSRAALCKPGLGQAEACIFQAALSTPPSSM